MVNFGELTNMTRAWDKEKNIYVKILLWQHPNVLGSNSIYEKNHVVFNSTGLFVLSARACKSLWYYKTGQHHDLYARWTLQYSAVFRLCKIISSMAEVGSTI